MNPLKLLLPLLLAACAAARPADSVLDLESPETAGVGAYLVASLDLSRPVVIQEGLLLEHGLLGHAMALGDRYVIDLDSRLSPREQMMVLIHELAHVLVWEAGDGDTDHGAPWGLAYSRVFQAWARESPDSP
jgi:hypothetical protein